MTQKLIIRKQLYRKTFHIIEKKLFPANKIQNTYCILLDLILFCHLLVGTPKRPLCLERCSRTNFLLAQSWVWRDHRLR